MSTEERKEDEKENAETALATKGEDEVVDRAEDASPTEESADDGEQEGALAPAQLGFRRFVYAAYFAGAIAVAFVGSKLGNLVWMRVAAYKPEIGEPKEEILMTISAVIGAAVAYYYWRKPATRKYAEEVASELSQVTWPTRTEVTNGTFVVIVATAFSTIFFALMDRFWGFLTNLVYGA